MHKPLIASWQPAHVSRIKEFWFSCSMSPLDAVINNRLWRAVTWTSHLERPKNVLKWPIVVFHACKRVSLLSQSPGSQKLFDERAFSQFLNWCISSPSNFFLVWSKSMWQLTCECAGVTLPSHQERCGYSHRAAYPCVVPTPVQEHLNLVASCFGGVARHLTLYRSHWELLIFFPHIWDCPHLSEHRQSFYFLLSCFSKKNKKAACFLF